MLSNNQNYAARSLKLPPQNVTKVTKALADAANKAAAALTDNDSNASVKRKALKDFSTELRDQNFSALSLDSLSRAAYQLLSQIAAKSSDPVAATNAIKSIIDSVVSQSIEPPKDVSCSMSVLPWDEAHKAFGRTVADTFLPVQIVVRNLDANNEYLIHDAEFAVDAVSAQLSRFQVGHEKELVRSVLQYGQSYDRQHVFINIVEGVGIIMGAVVGLPQPSISALVGASGAYHAGLLPVLHTFFPDLTTKNLNTLNDLAFSAASASRIVVPKSGSVPFVIFIPVRPLEQACWLQDAYNIYKDGSDATAWVDTCEQVCSTSTACSKLKELRYKNWKPVHLQALEKHGYALIAGVHIKEAGQPATLKSLVCAAPTDASGAYLKYSLPAAGLSCTLTGTDLDTLTVLRFRSPADSTTNLDAKVTVSGDNTAATAVLAPADAAKIAQASYELYGVDKSVAEHDLNRSVAFRIPPSIDKGQSVTGAAATVVTLKGSNLSGISHIVFYNQADSAEVTRADIVAAVPGSISFAIPTTPALATGTTYTIRLVIADGANNGAGTLYSTGTTVTH
jgi:hypothetical protein